MCIRDRHNVRLVVDESFVDFADEQDSTLLDNDVLEKFPTMTVVKSISKSFGVPGLRLGVLASADQEKIAHIKKDVAIWNINSFAESYLQIEEKYKKNYASAMARFREVREKMRAELEQVKGLRVLPSQANYFMCELTGEITAQELCVRLLHENLLIKDLSCLLYTSRCV